MTALVCLSAQTVNAQYKIEGSFKNIERKIHLVACTPNGLDTLASTFVDDKGHLPSREKLASLLQPAYVWSTQAYAFP